MTGPDDLSAPKRPIGRPGADKSAEDVGSRVEAAAAGVHHERAEAAEGIEPREHVTATNVVTPHLAHHHPEDANTGIVRGRPARGALLAAVLTAAVTVAGVVLFALAVGGKH